MYSWTLHCALGRCANFHNLTANGKADYSGSRVHGNVENRMESMESQWTKSLYHTVLQNLKLYRWMPIYKWMVHLLLICRML